MSGGTQTITMGSAGYPRRLVALAARRPTLTARLDVQGILEEAPLSVAIVGSRAASPAMQQVAFDLAAGLAASGAIVVSGGAYGIDAAAHRGALSAGGRTVVVLGCGIEVVYPARHANLFDEVVQGGGAVVSPFEPSAEPLGGRFVARNAVIAALADVTVVVEASARSGALHTATAARELDRFVAAVPGSAGCDGLLAAGASLLAIDADLAMQVVAIADGAGTLRALPPLTSLAPIGREALGALADDGLHHLEDIATRVSHTVRDTGRVLAELCAAGFVSEHAGSRFGRTGLCRTAMAGSGHAEEK